MKAMMMLMSLVSLVLASEVYLEGEDMKKVDSLFLLFASAEGTQKAFEQKLFRQKDMLLEDAATKAKYFDHMIQYGQATASHKKAWCDLVVRVLRLKYEYLYALSQAATGDDRARVFVAYKRALQEHGALARIAGGL
jgi:hypothetical protein